MYEIFMGALNGDPMYQQHLSWLVSKPAFWLMIAKWMMVACGIIWILRVLITARMWKAFCIFLALIVGACLVGVMLIQQSQLGFENGQGGDLTWGVFKLGADLFAIGVTLLLLWKWFFKGP